MRIPTLILLLLTAPCAAAIYIVDDDGPADCDNVQAAISDSNDGDIIVLFPGRYTGLGNKEINFLGKAITVRSVAPEDPYIVAATVIDCNSTGDAFRFEYSEGADSVLDGLTIVGGDPDTNSPPSRSTSSTSSYVYSLLTSSVSAQASLGSSRGIVCLLASPTITNCVITGHGHGGIHCYGDIRGGASAPLITQCTIADNATSGHGGGVYCEYNSSPIVTNCAITRNRAMMGGGVYCIGSGTPQIVNCTLVGNSAVDGGAIYCVTGATITNCTIASNSAEDRAGGVFCADSRVSLTNCILWANADSTGIGQDAQLFGNTPDIIFSCIQDDDPADDHIPFNLAGNGNIDDDPIFALNPDDGADGWGDNPETPDINEGENDEFGDLHLQKNSPCLNTGNQFSTGHDQTDMDGEPRVIGFRVDMGADEFTQIIIVTKPQGGEVWTTGSTHQIAWTTDFYQGDLDVLYSEDGGDNWQTVEANIPDTGSCLWLLPNGVDSSQCLVSVVPSRQDSDTATIGSGLFTIHSAPPGSEVESKWQSLGGGFNRAALSENQGPDHGCVKWEFQTDGPVLTGVTIGPNGRVHIASEDGKLYTLDPNGALLWSYDANSPLITAPTVGPDGSLHVGSENGILYVVDVNGSLRWTHTTAGPISSSPAISENGNIFVGSEDGTLYALAQDGSDLWTFQTKGPGTLKGGSIFASPAIGPDGSIYIGGLYDPNLYALDPNNGSVKWVCNFEYAVNPLDPSEKEGGWPAASPVIAQDGTIYQMLLYDPNLYAIEPNNGNVIWSTNLKVHCDFVDVYFRQYGQLPTAELIEQNCEHWFAFPPAPEGEAYSTYLGYKDASAWSEPAIGPDGTIYVSFDDPYLRAVEPNGSIKWMAPLGVLGGLTLTVGNDGLIYAAGDDGHLYLVDDNGWEVATFTTDAWLNYPVIATDNLLIVSDGNSVVAVDANNNVWAIGLDACQTPLLDLRWIEDLSADGKVNFTDFALWMADWLKCTYTSSYPGSVDPFLCEYEENEPYLYADLDRDMYVFFSDLAAFVDRWLGKERKPRPPRPPVPYGPPEGWPGVSPRR